MTGVLASVQTGADTAPTPLWQYALGALSLAVAIAALWVVPAFLDSTFHRRGVARLRAHRDRQRSTTR